MDSKTKGVTLAGRFIWFIGALLLLIPSGLYFSPSLPMSKLLKRPFTYRKPSVPIYPRSPVYNHPLRMVSAVLDGFFQALPMAEKQRVHFHDFFAQLHRGMFAHQKAEDALAITLDELLDGCRVLCFDEFHVSDIADAMILGRLMDGLFAKGVIVVTECEHMCMAMRGVNKPASRTITSAVRGVMRTPATRAEAMSLIMAKH